MNTTYESKKNLKKVSNYDTPEKYDSENQIVKYALQLNTMSHQTIRSKIHSFKKIMYFSSYDITNARIHAIMENALFIPAQLIPIHKLMYQYFCGPIHRYMQFTSGECSILVFNKTAFNLAVPNSFMPIFASYITALPSNLKPDCTIQHFFEEMDTTLYNICSNSDIKPEPDPNTIEFYVNWKEQYLYSTYFCKLEQMLDKYADTAEQRDRLITSVGGLTDILLNSLQRPNTVVSNVTLLLENYIDLLEKKNVSKIPPRRNLKLLYPHDEYWTLSNELSFIKGLLKPMSEATKYLLSSINYFMKNNRLKDSRYELALDNYSEFSKHTAAYLSCLEQFLNQLEDNIGDYYSLDNNPDIMFAIQNRTITINMEDRQKHMLTFYNLITRYYTLIKKDLSKFIKQVKKSSSRCPESYKKISPLPTNYVDTLNTDITKHLENLNSSITNNFQELPDFIIYHNPGYIKEIEYAYGLFSDEDIARIFIVLSDIPCDTPTELISNFLKSKGFRFPMLTKGIIELLSNFGAYAEEYRKIYFQM